MKITFSTVDAEVRQRKLSRCTHWSSQWCSLFMSPKTVEEDFSVEIGELFISRLYPRDLFVLAGKHHCMLAF